MLGKFMATVLGLISQKGGVGKSTLARLVAREYAAAGWNVKIADLDVSQGTSFNWQARRLQRAIEPAVAGSEGRIAEGWECIEQARYGLRAGSIPEKIGYRRASDEGRALTETRFPTLNARSDELVQGIINLITPKQRSKAHG